MKKISVITIAIIFYTITSSFSQKFLDEYKYFALRLGATHSFLDKQPESFNNFFYESPRGNMQLIPNSSYFGYTAGYYGGLIFNYDLKNDNMGFVGGIEYKHYGISAKYTTTNDDYSMVEKHRVSNISIPIYFKLGKKIYKKQRYFYAGIAIDFNLSSYSTQVVSNVKRKIKLEKDMIVGNNIEAIIGYNYGFLNFEINYVFGGFLNREYEVNFNDNTRVQPFSYQPRGALLIKTGLNIPLNSWTQRKVYAFQQFVRRLFGGR